MNLNLLLVFDALIATGSVTRAAERLGLTQSGASNALAQLRGVFGDELFERSGRGIRPTPRALELAPDVRRGIEAFERALAPRTFDRAQLRRTFHLAMPDAVQRVLLPGLLADVAREAPGVDVRVWTWPEQRVPDELASGALDVFAGFVGAVPAEHGSRVLWDDTYVCMLRRGHPALRGGALDVDGWLAHGHVVVSREAAGPTAVDRALADRGLRRRVALRVDNVLVLPAVIRATDLVAAVDRRWATALQDDALVLAEPPVPLPAGRVRLVWHRRADGDAAAAWLRDEIAAQVSPSG